MARVGINQDLQVRQKLLGPRDHARVYQIIALSVNIKGANSRFRQGGRRRNRQSGERLPDHVRRRLGSAGVQQVKFGGTGLMEKALPDKLPRPFQIHGKIRRSQGRDSRRMDLQKLRLQLNDAVHIHYPGDLRVAVSPQIICQHRAAK